MMTHFYNYYKISAPPKGGRFRCDGEAGATPPVGGCAQGAWKWVAPPPGEIARIKAQKYGGVSHPSEFL